MYHKSNLDHDRNWKENCSGVLYTLPVTTLSIWLKLHIQYQDAAGNFLFCFCYKFRWKLLAFICVSLKLDCETSLHLFQVEGGRKMYRIQSISKQGKKTKSLLNPLLHKLKHVFKQVIIGQIVTFYAAGQTRTLQCLCMYIQTHLYTSTFIYTHTNMDT